jgi:hypothetical protein
MAMIAALSEVGIGPPSNVSALHDHLPVTPVDSR